MNRLHALLEVERRKLNELGVKSLEQGTPLAEHKTVQAQSRKIDQLIIRLQVKNASRGSNNAEVKEEEDDGIQTVVSASDSAEIRSYSGSA